MNLVAQCAVLALALAVPATAACAYLLLLTALSGRLPRPPRSTRHLRFDIIVPAHDEAAVIRRVLASLAALDWPADRFQAWVIADNCTDATAALARAAGAQVMERCDPARGGKGRALAYAFAASRERCWADAVVVVDADSEVSANLLEAFAARIERGAEALQADYGVLNRHASWRTRLLAIAHGAFHTLRSRARERAALSCGLRGNGWCVTRRLLSRIPYTAFSLTEDLEYGIVLGLAGVRVHYAGEAHADAEMTTVAAVAGTQRRRWESGRFALARSHAGPLLAAALAQRSAVCLDLALDLLVPPLSWIALMVAGLALLAGAGWRWLPDPGAAPWLAGFACAALLIYVLRGWQLGGVGLRGLADLARAPFFVLWKLSLLGSRQKAAWVRTHREIT